MTEQAHIPVLAKAVRLLRALAEGAGAGSMNSLARRLDIAPATCFRILRTLQNADWIRPREGGGFELSLGLLPLVEPLVGVHRLADALCEPLAQLARETELSVKLSIRQAHAQLVIHRAESPRRFAVTGRIGARFSVLTGSSGAALLVDRGDEHIRSMIDAADDSVWREQPAAEVWRRIRQCRRTGLCSSIGVHPQGIDTISAPLRGAKGGVLAAVTVMGLRGDLDRKAAPQIRKHLRQTMEQCQQRVAGLPVAAEPSRASS